MPGRARRRDRQPEVRGKDRSRAESAVRYERSAASVWPSSPPVASWLAGSQHQAVVRLRKRDNRSAARTPAPLALLLTQLQHSDQRVQVLGSACSTWPNASVARSRKPALRKSIPGSLHLIRSARVRSARPSRLLWTWIARPTWPRSRSRFRARARPRAPMGPRLTLVSSLIASSLWPRPGSGGLGVVRRRPERGWSRRTRRGRGRPAPPPGPPPPPARLPAARSAHRATSGSAEVEAGGARSRRRARRIASMNSRKQPCPPRASVIMKASARVS